MNILHREEHLKLHLKQQGFSIEKMGNYFLITAKHVIRGCKDSVKIDNFPDVIYVWLTKGYNKPVMKPINIKMVRDKLKCQNKLTKEEPDVISIPVTDTIFNNVYSVEDFILPRFYKAKQIEIYGYPDLNKTNWNYITLYVPPSHLYIPEHGYELATNTDTLTHITDEFDYSIYTTKIAIDNRLHGYSGAPVFVKDSETTKWRLLGVFVRHTETNIPEDKAIIIVRVDYVLKELKKRKR
jgi:hypothetical protein